MTSPTLTTAMPWLLLSGLIFPISFHSPWVSSHSRMSSKCTYGQFPPLPPTHCDCDYASNILHRHTATSPVIISLLSSVAPLRQSLAEGSGPEYTHLDASWWRSSVLARELPLLPPVTNYVWDKVYASFIESRICDDWWLSPFLTTCPLA